MSYEYHYENGEANFGPPLQSEVRGGAHLTFDVICHVGKTLVAFRRPDGLHGEAKNALYFPHGLIRFGETVDECVQRLVDEQGGGATVIGTRLYTMPSWVENEHWHMCLNVLAALKEMPTELSEDVSETVRVERGHPGSDFGWWSNEQLAGVFDYLDEID